MEQCHHSKITAYAEECREEEGEKRTGSWRWRGRQLTGVEGLGEEEESMGGERRVTDGEEGSAAAAALSRIAMDGAKKGR
jgi:hypothetical protein